MQVRNSSSISDFIRRRQPTGATVTILLLSSSNSWHNAQRFSQLLIIRRLMPSMLLRMQMVVTPMLMVSRRLHSTDRVISLFGHTRVRTSLYRMRVHVSSVIVGLRMMVRWRLITMVLPIMVLSHSPLLSSFLAMVRQLL